jgi:hypothetical protein
MTNNIWIRLGCTLNLTDEEIEKALSGNPEQLEEVITAAISNGRFRLDGESYIPENCVEAFNEQHGTSYPVTDYETDI